MGGTSLEVRMLRGDSSSSVLIPGMLNVVGESHNESKLRRAEEKQFAKERTGSDNYWTEDEFPDMQANFGVREEHQPDEQSGADLMEYRAVHGATLLIKESEKVVAVAAKIGTIKIDNLTPDKVSSFNAVIAKFDKSIEDFRQFAVRVRNSLTATMTEDVNKVVNAIFDRVNGTCQAYAAAPKTTPSELRAAALMVSTKLLNLPKVLPLLEKVSGVATQQNTLSEQMRTQRSTFMGLAANNSGQVGVWKVGSLHVEDLLSGRSKVLRGRVNFVKKEDFNAEFDLWNTKT
jgi:hypothetical protein